MKIDIRESSVNSIKTIEFAEKRPTYKSAIKLCKSSQGLTIESYHSSDCVVVHVPDDLDNLILALNKAKELGWV